MGPKSKNATMRPTKSAIVPMDVSESDSVTSAESLDYPTGVKFGFIIVALTFSIILVGLVSILRLTQTVIKIHVNLTRTISLSQLLFQTLQMILRPLPILAGIQQHSKRFQVWI